LVGFDLTPHNATPKDNRCKIEPLRPEDVWAAFEVFDAAADELGNGWLDDD
jgi:hypothetical protein